MPWTPTLNELRDVLADLYDDDGNRRRVAAEAGLGVKDVDFAGPSIVAWQRILETAQKHGRLAAIVDVVRGEYGGNSVLSIHLDLIALQLAAEDAGAWSAAVEHLPGSDDPPPLPGPLPPGSQMPFGRNALFTGRQRDLQALARLLLHGPGRAAVTGWGGVGKTQLAVEFCHRYGRFFHGGVFWLNAASPETLAADLAQCGLSMGLQPWPDKRPEQIAAVLRAWQSGEPRLVTLDNFEDLDLARAWLPQLGGVRLLITARRSQWPADLAIAGHPLDVLARAESLSLLRQLAPRLVRQPDGELDPVANALGDLPLAVDLAGRYLADRPGLSPAGYQEELAQAGISAHTSFVDWTEGGDSPTGHATSLAATFLVSWGRLKPDAAVDALATKLFRAAAWCAASAPIPRAVFYRLEAGQEAAVDRALKRLAALGLLGGGDEVGPLIHPLLAEFGQRIETGEGSVLAALAEAIADLAEDTNAEMDLTGGFAPYQSLWRHVQAMAGRAEADAPEAAGSLWNSLGYHLHRMADYAGARAAFEYALAIDECTYGPDHPTVARDVNNLGRVLRALGDLPAARAAFERALAIDSQAFGLDYFDVARDINNLGGVLHDMGNLPAARAAFERAMSIVERSFGPDHPNVAICVNNLGSVLRDFGDLPAARAAFERALAITERTFGPDHPHVAICVNNVGLILQSQDDLPAARAAFERALAINERAFGPDHPHVAINSDNLAGVLRALDDLPAARAALDRALAISERAFSSDHPNVARYSAKLGSVLQVMGDLPAARAALERALAIDERTFGPDHLTVARNVNNLGLVLKAQGDLVAARAAYERALVSAERTFGPDHPNVAKTISNLGLVLHAQGDLPAARAAFERALAIFEQSLPPGHPTIEIVRSNLESVR